VTKFGHLAKIFKTDYDGLVRKFCISSFIVFTALILFYFSTKPSYAATKCTINTNLAWIINYDYNGDVIITSDSCNFAQGTTYTILMHPSEITSGKLYINYPFSKKMREDARKIIMNVNLNSGEVGKNNSGWWTLEICTKDNVSECENPDNIIANKDVYVSSEPKPTGTSTPPTSSVCLTYDEYGKCTTINTAIGEISTDPAEFVQKIFSIVLGLSGGIALVMIILSGYKFMFSSGNPEKVKAATEQLTSSIIGLVFIICAFVVLQIIGVDILRIPGFTK
jgi:YD repeat-containing protein